MPSSVIKIYILLCFDNISINILAGKEIIFSFLFYTYISSMLFIADTGIENHYHSDCILFGGFCRNP